ncbi:MAG: glycosyl hydrolase [Parachlamydiales bacterium]|jgi:hypothetical protein
MKKNILVLVLIFLLFLFSFLYFLKEKKRPILGVCLKKELLSPQLFQSLPLNLGYEPGIVSFQLNWNQPPDTLNQLLELIWQARAVPAVVLEPKGVLLQDLLQHKYDNYLRSLSAVFKHFQKPLIILLAPSMNRQENHFGIRAEGFNLQSPAAYRKLFRYVVRFFQEQKTCNLLFAFVPAARSYPCVFWNLPERFYPEDELVDLVGLNDYNGEIAPENQVFSPSAFSEALSFSYSRLKKIAGKKAFFIFETKAALEGEERFVWLEQRLKTLSSWQIRGVLWNPGLLKNSAFSQQQKRLFQNHGYSRSAQKWAEAYLEKQKKKRPKNPGR